MNKGILSILRVFCSPEHYARMIGVKIGVDSSVKTRNWSSEPYLITIGDHVQITNNVSFFTHGGGHVIRKEHPDFDFFGRIHVEDWVYIGSNALIMPGVILGEGCIVAAGSVVTKSVPPYSVVAGNPARLICSVSEFYEKNKRFNTRTKGLSASKKREVLLSLPDEMFLHK